MSQTNLNLKESINNSINEIIQSPEVKSAFDLNKIKVTNYNYNEGKLDLEITDKILLGVLSKNILAFKNHLEQNHKWIIREIKLNDSPLEFKLLDTFDSSYYDSSKKGTTLSLDTNNFSTQSDQGVTYEVFNYGITNDELLIGANNTYQMTFANNLSEMKIISFNPELVDLLKLNKFSPIRYFKLKKYQKDIIQKQKEIDFLLEKGYSPINKNFEKLIEIIFNK